MEDTGGLQPGMGIQDSLFPPGIQWDMSFVCKFSWLQNYHILLKSVNIWPSNLKNEKGELFVETQCNNYLVA